MKKLFLLFAGILVAGVSISQIWAPQGAEWFYEFNNFSYTGYMKITASGDTVINGTNCRILSKELISYNYSNEQYDTLFPGNEYMYSDENKVYIYRQESFFTLYDFGANAGDTWEIPALYTGYCDSIGTVIVDSTATTVINGEMLRVIYVSPYEESHWTLAHRIIEKIGCVDYYMLPETTENCGIADIFEAGPLRCYSDNSFGLYSTGIAESCDFITGVNDYWKKNVKISVYPNPAKDYFVFEVSPRLITPQVGIPAVSIFNAYGQKVAELPMRSEKTVWQTGDVEAGLYFYRMETEGKVVSGKVLIMR